MNVWLIFDLQKYVNWLCVFLEVNPCFQRVHDVFCMDLQPAADPYNVVCRVIAALCFIIPFCGHINEHGPNNWAQTQNMCDHSSTLTPLHWIWCRVYWASTSIIMPEQGPYCLPVTTFNHVARIFTSTSTRILDRVRKSGREARSKFGEKGPQKAQTNLPHWRCTNIRKGASVGTGEH